jgi:DNA-binding protein YbaB
MDFSSLLEQASMLKDKIQNSKESLATKTLTITGGNGAIKITVNGIGRIMNVNIAPHTQDNLQEATFNQILQDTINLALESSKKMAANLLEESIGFNISDQNIF